MNYRIGKARRVKVHYCPTCNGTLNGETTIALGQEELRAAHEGDFGFCWKLWAVATAGRETQAGQSRCGRTLANGSGSAEHAARHVGTTARQVARPYLEK